MIDKKELSDYMRENGKKGGKSTMERHGREHFSAIAKAKKGSTWSWDPAKKGKRKPKVTDGLQKSVIDDIIPPTVGMTEVINK